MLIKGYAGFLPANALMGISNLIKVIGYPSGLPENVKWKMMSDYSFDIDERAPCLIYANSLKMNGTDYLIDTASSSVFERSNT